ncbi:MAG: hypothetical protein QOH16_1468 [Gaiellaceae bacterium]|nr:hypothetical protein [Gaiellaceae bacterium]
MTREDNRRLCVFCGGEPTTNEHIFPFWLPEAVGGDTTHLRLEGRERGPGVGEQFAYDHKWTTNRADIKVRAVCRACNNGWMNDLDHD